MRHKKSETTFGNHTCQEQLNFKRNLNGPYLKALNPMK